MAYSLQELQQIANTQKTQFNYRLPTGEIIQAGINPSEAATVDLKAIITGGAAAPVPREILEAGKQMGVGDYKYNALAAVQPSINAEPTKFNVSAPTEQQTQQARLQGAGVTQEQLDASSKARVGVPTPKPTTIPGQSPLLDQIGQQLQSITTQFQQIQQQAQPLLVAGGITTTPAPSTSPSETNLNNIFGGNAKDTLSMLNTMALFGYDPEKYEDLQEDIEETKGQISNFFSGAKSAEQILQAEFEARGIEKSTTLLNDLDARIREKTKILKDLPDAVKNSLADVGVSEAQLTRLVAREAKNPTEDLNELLIERNALASDINTAMSFAEKFANTKLADQASKLAAYQWELISEQGELKDMSADRKDFLNYAINDQKEKMSIALEVAKNGGTSEQIDAILSESDSRNALVKAGDLLQTQDKPTTIGGEKTGWFQYNPTTKLWTKIVAGSEDPKIPSGKSYDITNLEDIKNLPVSSLTKSIMSGFAKVKDLTATDKAKVLEEMYEIGFNPQQFVMNKIYSLIGDWGAIPDVAKGLINGLKFWEINTIPEVATFESNKAILTREIARLNDVGMLSDQDVATYEGAMPSRQNMTMEVVMGKVKGVSSAILGKQPENFGQVILHNETGKKYIIGPQGVLFDYDTGTKSTLTLKDLE